ncbi:MAG: hypothetical protein AAGC83_06055 [Pseudomonadota bacterium]
MSRFLDRQLRQTGTRFKLYPQTPALPDYKEPETVWLSPPPGTIGEGPSDDRMYVVHAINKKMYKDGSRLPYDGKAKDPAKPDAQGHFDYIDKEDSTFLAAHMYAGVRRTLDIWEGYAGHRIEWHFAPFHERLEMIPYLKWRNAHFGLGFMECGYEHEDRDETKKSWPYSLNFDVLSHETGHGIVWSMLGMPMNATLTAEYLGFLEASADLVCLISTLHFDSLLDKVFEKTGGNLYIENEANAIGDISKTAKLRSASNDLRMSDGPDPNRSAMGPNALTGKEIHKLCDPLTGAVFDLMIAMYHENLVHKGLIGSKLARDSRRFADKDEKTDPNKFRDDFQKAFDKAPEGFREALEDARDQIGDRLVRTWKTMSPHNLTYAKFARDFMTIDRRLSGWENQDEIIQCFRWRFIGERFGQQIADARAETNKKKTKKTKK